MGRPTDWHPLADVDPLPGDPGQVAELGRKLRQTADNIQQQADDLRKLCTDEFWDSDAGREFRKTAEDTAGKLKKAFRRYDAAAQALGQSVSGGGYAAELDKAQRMADAALARAKDADIAARRAQTSMDGTAEADKNSQAYKDSQRNKQQADGVLGEAQSALQKAVGMRDSAAKAAASAIKTAIDNDGLKDTRWSKFKDWVHDNADWIKKVTDIASWVATIAGTLALVVGWIPVIGQALAGVLGTIALIASIVALAGHLLLALSGDGRWSDVVIDVIAVATFGLGRAAVGAVKGSTAAARATSRSAAYRQAIAAGHKQNKAWRLANQATAGPRGRAAAEAMQNAPGRFPGFRQIAGGFNPVSIARETWQNGKVALNPSNIRQAFASWRTGVPQVGDAGLTRAFAEMARVNPNLLANQAVRPFVTNAGSNVNLWFGSTVVGVGSDYLDKLGVWEGLGLKGTPAGSK